jgi:ABC-type protease/lipase transport system fused ATPase/permease subunit
MPEAVPPGTLRLSRSLIRRSGFGPVALAAGLIFCAGLMSAAGALFIVALYGRLIPSASMTALALTFGGVAGLMVVQGLLRYFAGQMADRAGSAMYFRIRNESGPEPAEGFVPVLRALRGRVFPAAADLSWVPVFFAVAGFIHPAFAILAVLFSVLFFRLGQTEPLTPASRLDEAMRERDRWRRGLVATLRDLAQVSLLGLGGALAISGAVHIGELVAATMLSMRALAAIQVAAEERTGILEAWKAWRAMPPA